MKVTVIRNQGKSISTVEFPTKTEAVTYIDMLGDKRTMTITRIRRERRYIVNIQK